MPAIRNTALVLALLWAPWLAAQQALPPLQGRVTDTSATLSADQIQQIDSQLAALEQRKGSQLVVVVVATTQPEPIEDYSIRLAQQWKIGRGKVQGKKVDDGVILLVAKNDRRVRIEVGYGLEGAIPDALAKRIITEAMTPKFRAGDYYGGISAGIADLTRLIDGEPLPEPWHDKQRPAAQTSGQGDDLGYGPILFALFAGFVASAILGTFLGSLAGGGGAGFMALTAGLSLPIAALIGAGGFVLLLIVGASRRALNPIGDHTYRPRGGIFPGGFGGGGGGFGGGGGGFGGGGGGFGGGGASGSW